MERRSIARIAAGVATKLHRHISIKDNVFAAVFDSGERRHIGATLNCVILDMNEKMSRIFWGVDSEYDENNPGPPLCFSENGIAPSVRCDEPQAPLCAPDREGVRGCRWSVWGSATSKKTGKGIPACREYLKLAILPLKLKKEKNKQDWVPEIENAPDTVFFLGVPPGSLKTVSGYGRAIHSMGKIHPKWEAEEIQVDLPYVVTEVTFGGYGALQFRPVGYITEDINAVIEELDQYKVDIAIGRDDEPILALPAPETDVTVTVHPPRPVEGYKGLGPDAEQSENPAALPQPKAPIASERRNRGRPRKENGTPAAIAKAPSDGTGPFVPKPNSRIVTAEEVRDEARARQEQEQKEAEQFGIAESAPEPPEDILDQFMKLDLK